MRLFLQQKAGGGPRPCAHAMAFVRYRGCITARDYQHLSCHQSTSSDSMYILRAFCVLGVLYSIQLTYCWEIGIMM